MALSNFTKTSIFMLAFLSKNLDYKPQSINFFNRFLPNFKTLTVTSSFLGKKTRKNIGIIRIISLSYSRFFVSLLKFSNYQRYGNINLNY